MILDSTLDLIAVTETWLSADDYVTPGEICPPKYNLIHTPRLCGKGGGIAHSFSLWHQTTCGMCNPQ